MLRKLRVKKECCQSHELRERIISPQLYVEEKVDRKMRRAKEDETETVVSVTCLSVCMPNLERITDSDDEETQAPSQNVIFCEEYVKFLKERGVNKDYHRQDEDNTKRIIGAVTDMESVKMASPPEESQRDATPETPNGNEKKLDEPLNSSERKSVKALPELFDSDL